MVANPMKTRTGKISLTLAATAAVVALSACGSSGAKATVSPGAQPPATTAAPGTTGGANTKPVVATTVTAKFGSVLVDDKGMTLYTLKNNGAPVACTGPCADAWPPLVVPAGVTSVSGSGVTGLGTVVKGGATHVTHDGAPLYRFKGDTAPGDTNGDGIANFGGVWNVATTAAASEPAPATTPATTAPPETAPTTSSSGGGYGY